MFPGLSVTLNDIEIVEIIFYSDTVIFHSESAKFQTPCRLRITIRVCEQMGYIVDFASREFSMRIVETAITFRNNFKITKRLNWSITEMQRVFLIIYNSLQSRSTGIDSASTQSKNIRCKNMAETRAKFNYVVNMSRGMALLTRFIS